MENKKDAESEVLVEKEIVSFCQRIFKIECAVYFCALLSFSYIGISFPLGIFSRNVSLGIIAPGFAANSYVLHARTIKYPQLEAKLPSQMDRAKAMYQKYY